LIIKVYEQEKKRYYRRLFVRVEKLMLAVENGNEERKKDPKIYAGNGLSLSRFALATPCAKM